MSSSEVSRVPFVPETAFGIWFLRTHTWEHHVLRVAIADLKRLIDAPLPDAPVIVDVGCGQGISFRLLAEAFKPRRIVGIDFHGPSLQAAANAAHACRPTVADIELLHGDCANLPLPDASADIVLLPSNVPPSGRAGPRARRIPPCAQTGRHPAVRRIDRRLHQVVGDPAAVPSSDAGAKERRRLPRYAAPRRLQLRTAQCVAAVPVVGAARKTSACSNGCGCIARNPASAARRSSMSRRSRPPEWGNRSTIRPRPGGRAPTQCASSTTSCPRTPIAAAL